MIKYRNNVTNPQFVSLHRWDNVTKSFNRTCFDIKNELLAWRHQVYHGWISKNSHQNNATCLRWERNQNQTSGQPNIGTTSIIHYKTIHPAGSDASYDDWIYNYDRILSGHCHVIFLLWQWPFNSIFSDGRMGMNASAIIMKLPLWLQKSRWYSNHTVLFMAFQLQLQNTILNIMPK